MYDKIHKSCNGFCVYVWTVYILWSAVACTTAWEPCLAKRERFETSVIVNVICLYLLALRRATYIRKFRKDEMTSCRIFFFISSGSILGPSPSNFSILNTIWGDFTLKKAYQDLRLQKHGLSGKKKKKKLNRKYVYWRRTVDGEHGGTNRTKWPMGEVKKSKTLKWPSFYTFTAQCITFY